MRNRRRPSKFVAHKHSDTRDILRMEKVSFKKFKNKANSYSYAPNNLNKFSLQFEWNFASY